MHRFKAALLVLVLGCGSSSSMPDGADALVSDAGADASPDSSASEVSADASTSDAPADATVTGAPADAMDVAAADGAGPAVDGEGFRFDSGIFDEATLTVAPTAYSFADTIAGSDTGPAKFTVTNIGFEATGPVSHVVEGSTEFVITGSTCGQPLAHDGSCDLSIVFRPVSAGAKMARLTVSATPGKVFSTLLYGNAVVPAAARLEPSVYTFPSVVKGGMPAAAAFTVINTGGTALGPPAATIEPAGGDGFLIGTDGCAGALLQPGADCDITVWFSPTSAGYKSATLTVSLGTLVLHASVSGTALEPAALTLAPITQSFGAVPVGMKSTFAFNVTNTGGAATGKLAIIFEGMNYDEFTAKSDPPCNLPLNPGDSCPIAVTFSPTKPGPKTAVLRVSASPGGFVKADLTGTGTN